MPRPPKWITRAPFITSSCAATRALPVAVDAVDHQRALNLLERAASRFELVCHAWCLSPEPLPSPSDVAARQPVARDALARDMQRALLQPQARTIRPPLSRAIRIEARRGRCHFARAGALSPAQPGAGGTVSLAGGLALVELRGDSWACGRRRGSLTRANSSQRSARSDAYVAWVAAGVDATILDERGFRQPAPRPSLVSLLADGSDDSIALAHSHGYSTVGNRTASRREPVTDQPRLAAYSGVRHAYCVPDPEYASTLRGGAGRSTRRFRWSVPESSSSSRSTAPRGPGRRRVVVVSPSPATGSASPNGP